MMSSLAVALSNIKRSDSSNGDRDSFHSQHSFSRRSTSVGSRQNSFGRLSGSAHGSSSRICKFYLRGTCTRGSSCPFLHQQSGNNQLLSRPPTSRSQSVCKFFLNGNCKRGSSCVFRHELNDDDTISVVTMGSGVPIQYSNSQRVCKYFANGYCSRGNSCNFLHQTIPNNIPLGHSSAVSTPAAPAVPKEKPTIEAIRARAARAKANGTVVPSLSSFVTNQPSNEIGVLKVENEFDQVKISDAASTIETSLNTAASNQINSTTPLKSNTNRQSFDRDNLQSGVTSYQQLSNDCIGDSDTSNANDVLPPIEPANAPLNMAFENTPNEEILSVEDNTISASTQIETRTKPSNSGPLLVAAVCGDDTKELASGSFSKSIERHDDPSSPEQIEEHGDEKSRITTACIKTSSLRVAAKSSLQVASKQSIKPMSSLASAVAGKNSQQKTVTLEESLTSTVRPNRSFLESSTKTTSLKSLSSQQIRPGASSLSAAVCGMPSSLGAASTATSSSSVKPASPPVTSALVRTSSLQAATKTSLQTAPKQSIKPTSSLASAVSNNQSPQRADMLEKPSHYPKSCSLAASAKKSSLSAAASKKCPQQIEGAESSLATTVSKQTSTSARPKMSSLKAVEKKSTEKVTSTTRSSQRVDGEESALASAVSKQASSAARSKISSLAAAQMKTAEKVISKTSKISSIEGSLAVSPPIETGLSLQVESSKDFLMCTDSTLEISSGTAEGNLLNHEQFNREKEETQFQLRSVEQVPPSLQAATSKQHTKSSLAAACSKTQCKPTVQRSTNTDKVVPPSLSATPLLQVAIPMPTSSKISLAAATASHLSTSSKKLTSSMASKSSLAAASNIKQEVINPSSIQAATKVQGSNQTFSLSATVRDEAEKKAQAPKQTYSSLLTAASKESSVGGDWPHKNQSTHQSYLPTKSSNRRGSSAAEKGNGRSVISHNPANQHPHLWRQQSKSSEPTTYAATTTKTNSTIANNQGRVASYAAALNKKSPSQAQAQHQQYKQSIQANNYQASNSSYQHAPSSNYHGKELKSISAVSENSPVKSKPKKRWGDESDSDSD